MAKTKIQKKKTNKKLTIAAIEKKIKKKKIVTTKKSLPKTKPVKNKISNKPKVKTTSKIVKNNIKTINKKIEPKIPEIYDQELDSDVEIPIIEKTLNKNDKTIKQLSNDEIQEKIEAKVKEKLDAKIDKKIEEKLAANNQDIKEKEKEKRTVTIGSRKIAKKEDVFSKIGEWFSSLTNDINNSIRKRKVTDIKKYTKNSKKKKKISIEEPKAKVYPKNKFLKALVKIHENLYIPFDTIIVLTYIVLIVGMCRVQVIPSSTIKYIAFIAGFLGIVAVSLNKYISGRIFTILITAGMLCGIYYLNYTYDFINNLNTKLYEYQEYYVVALENGRNKSIYNINNKKVGLLKNNSKNIKHVLNTKLDRITYITYENQDKLYEEFINNKTRAIVVKENQYKYIQNNNIQANVKVKILYKFNVNTKKNIGEK